MAEYHILIILAGLVLSILGVYGRLSARFTKVELASADAEKAIDKTDTAVHAIHDRVLLLEFSNKTTTEAIGQVKLEVKECREAISQQGHKTNNKLQEMSNVLTAIKEWVDLQKEDKRHNS